MPVIGFDPDLTPHYCTRPDPTSYNVGTVWECDDCKKRYRAESVRDRGITNTEWVAYTGFRTLSEILGGGKK